jgi:hypothetical protein
MKKSGVGSVTDNSRCNMGAQRDTALDIRVSLMTLFELRAEIYFTALRNVDAMSLYDC